tara:strand:+ start:893 stop:1441 length:549 start_codon:yes stop_codon:yes gene_type:complete
LGLNQFLETDEVDLTSDDCTALIKVSVGNVFQQSRGFGLSVSESILRRSVFKHMNSVFGCFETSFKPLKSSVEFLDQSEKVDRLWWLKLYETSDEAVPTQDDITNIFKHLNLVISEGHIRDVDLLLFVLSDKKMSLELKSSVLRFTYPMRDKLSAWRTAVENIKTKIEDNGDNPKDLLFGLI